MAFLLGGFVVGCLIGPFLAVFLYERFTARG